MKRVSRIFCPYHQAGAPHHAARPLLLGDFDLFMGTEVAGAGGDVEDPLFRPIGRDAVGGLGFEQRG